MKKVTLYRTIPALAVITLGAVICLSSILPELKKNPLYICLFILIIAIIQLYIIIQLSDNIRNRVKLRQASDRPLPMPECWKALVAEWLSRNTEPGQREFMQAFVMALLTRIEQSNQIYSTGELRKNILEYIRSPLEMSIEYIVPVSSPEQINNYRTEAFQVALKKLTSQIAELQI